MFSVWCLWFSVLVLVLFGVMVGEAIKMLEKIEEQVPERWDDEFDEASKVHHYEREFLLSLQNSPFSQQKPTFLIDVEIVLDSPHDPTNPLDPSKKIDIMLCKRITNRANRPTFPSQKTKFDNWWAQKQEQVAAIQDRPDPLKPIVVADEEVFSYKKDGQIIQPIETDKQKLLQERLPQNGHISVESSEDISACEKIIYNCVESVLMASDEDYVNNNNGEVPQAEEEKKAQEDYQKELVFDDVKSISYPSRNLSVNMAIISRRRMASSMRVGSSRLKRVSPPSRPLHPSIDEWIATQNTPYHLSFDNLVSSSETNDCKTSSLSAGSQVLVGQRKVSPRRRTNLVSVSKDLLEMIDPDGVVYSKTPGDIVINDTSCLSNENHTDINNEEESYAKHISPKKSVNEFLEQENMNNNYLLEELPSTNDMAIIPEEKTAVIMFQGSETCMNSVPEHRHHDYAETDSNTSEQNTDKYYKNEEKACDITNMMKNIPSIISSTILTENEEQIIVKSNSEDEQVSDRKHRMNLIETICEPERLNDDLGYPLGNKIDIVSHAIDETVYSGKDNPDFGKIVREINTMSLMDSLQKPSTEEFVEPKFVENDAVCNIEELGNINEKVTTNSEINIISDCEASNEEDSVRDEDLLLNNCQQAEKIIEIENQNIEEFEKWSYPKEMNKINDVSVHMLPGRNREGSNSNHKIPQLASINHNVDTLDDFDDDLSIQGFNSIQETKDPHILVDIANHAERKSVVVDSKQKNTPSKTKKQPKLETGNNEKRKKLSATRQKVSMNNDANKSPQKNNITKTDKQSKLLDINNISMNDMNKKQNKIDMVKPTSNMNQQKTNSIKTEQTDSAQIAVNCGFDIDNMDVSYPYDENESHEEWRCQRKSRRKRTSSKDTHQQSQIVNNISDSSTNSTGCRSKGSDEQLRYTPSERAVATKSQNNYQSNSNFPTTNGMWREPKVRTFCSKNYVMYIIRGIPGSGKTTVAQEIKKKYSGDDAYICSARNVRYSRRGDGHYEQDMSEVFISQSECQEQARTQCRLGRNVIIIDDAHICYEEFQFYLQLAHHNDYIVNIIEPDMHVDIDICFKRNKHDVPKNNLEYMKSIYQELIGYYYGWCISLLDTLDLRGSACNIIQSHSADIPAFRTFIYKQNLQQIENLFHIYHMKSSSSSKNMLHVTCCYTNNGRRPGSKNYARSQHVLDALGNVCELQIIGLCITQKSLFARVLLSEDQKLVWGNNDSRNGEINRLHKECYLDNNTISEHVIGKDCDGEDWHSKLSPQNLAEHVSKIYNFIQNMEENYLIPDFGIGCTAHVTLGVVEGFGPVTSRENLKDIITLELNEKPKLQYTFSSEMVRCYGDNLWVMYFKESIVIPAMFCGTYHAEKSS